MTIFEFADLRFRPVEKDDLKLLHAWENDFELMMYSRSRPLNVVSMAQLEERYAEWMKKERDLYFIVENVESKEPIGFAAIRMEVWGNVLEGTLVLTSAKRNYGRKASERR